MREEGSPPRSFFGRGEVSPWRGHPWWAFGVGSGSGSVAGAGKCSSPWKLYLLTYLFHVLKNHLEKGEMERGGIPKGRGAMLMTPLGGQDLGLGVPVWGLRGPSWGFEVTVEVLEVEIGGFGVTIGVLGGPRLGCWSRGWGFGGHR